MAESYRIAHELDRVARTIDAQMHKRMPRVDTHRVGPLGGLVLLHLSDLQPCSVQKLCAQVGRDPSQMTRVLRGLESKGFVLRGTNEGDRRISILELSPSGEQFVERIRETLSEIVDGIVEPLSELERRLFLELLVRL